MGRTSFEIERKRKVPFGFAQGRLSTSLATLRFGRDDRFERGGPEDGGAVRPLSAARACAIAAGTRDLLFEVDVLNRFDGMAEESGAEAAEFFDRVGGEEA